MTPHGRRSAIAAAALCAAAGAMIRAVPLDEAPPHQPMGADLLLARETARMRDALATAALGGDHELLVARKRSTDWAFLATALTVAIASGARTPGEMLGSITDCDAGSHRTGTSPPRGACLLLRATDAAARAARTGRRHITLPALHARSLLAADAITYSDTGTGSDFPCAIRWRIGVDERGVHARVLWHEPMLALRAIDVPLVPDRTAIDIDPQLVRVRCWGFGTRADPWPGAPAQLDQVGDGYDFADAARHWWWSRAHDLAAVPILPWTAHDLAAVSALPGTAHALPECDAIRHAPWRVIARHSPDASHMGAVPESAERASLSVPLRAQPARLAIDDRGRSISVREESDDGTLRVLWWQERSEPDPEPWPRPEWRAAQSRIAAAQAGSSDGLAAYEHADIAGPHVDESVAHARATAHVWHMATAGDGNALVQALEAAETVRRSRGLPLSIDAMALASLAESLAMRDAPDWAIAAVVVRHAILTISLPADAAAARAAWSATEIAPCIDQPRYGAMLQAQGRHWGALILGATGASTPARTSGQSDPPDLAVAQFNSRWMALAPCRPRADAREPAASAARDDLDVRPGTAQGIDARGSDA